MRACKNVQGPSDQTLHFTSSLTGEPQPYRLFLPSSYDGVNKLPLLIALHGTGGDQNKYFDHETYGNGIYKTQAEKYGVAVLCPYGNDAQNRPTEWRGTGEIHVFDAIADACRRYSFDHDRLILTGQSMGGTGTTYLCCRYPHVFAAGIPLASTYGHTSLLTNLRHVPMYYIQGEQDWPIYAKTGPIPITEELKRLGYTVDLWSVPGVGHNTMTKSTPRVFEIALKHRRVTCPKRITHRAYFAAHGQAWWADIQKIEKPGEYASMDLSAADQTIKGEVHNTAVLSIDPPSKLFDMQKPIRIVINDETVFYEKIQPKNRIRMEKKEHAWVVSEQPCPERSPLESLHESMAHIEKVPVWSKEAETTLGNWISDAMRYAVDAEIAICNKGHYLYEGKPRGSVPQKGVLRMVDLIDWLRPLDTALVVAKLTGQQLADVIEYNLADDEPRMMIQPSGFGYTYDPSRPNGQRVVKTDLERERTYRVACKVGDLTRTDTMRLGDYYDHIEYEIEKENLLSAVWKYAQANQGIIRSAIERRVVRV